MERKDAAPTPARKIVYHRRLAVLCPVCGRRVCDISPKSRMDPYSEDDTEKPPWDPDVYIRCAGCKAEVALYRSIE